MLGLPFFSKIKFLFNLLGLLGLFGLFGILFLAYAPLSEAFTWRNTDMGTKGCEGTYRQFSWSGKDNIDVTFVAFGDTQYYGGDKLAKDVEANRRNISAINKIAEQNWPSWAGGALIGQSPIRGVMMAGDIAQNARDGREDEGAAVDKEKSNDEVGTFTRMYGLCGNKTNSDVLIKYDVYEGYGNHDYYEWSDTRYATGEHPGVDLVVARNKYRTMLSNIASAEKGHYSWDWDGVHFVNLNLKMGDDYDASKYTGDKEGLLDPRGAFTFLKEDLQKFVKTSDRPVVLMSHYGFSNWHIRTPPETEETGWWTSQEAQKLFELLENYNVVAIIHGHDHGTDYYDSPDGVVVPFPNNASTGKTYHVFNVGSPKVNIGAFGVFRITNNAFYAMNVEYKHAPLPEQITVDQKWKLKHVFVPPLGAHMPNKDELAPPDIVDIAISSTGKTVALTKDGKIFEKDQDGKWTEIPTAISQGMIQSFDLDKEGNLIVRDDLGKVYQEKDGKWEDAGYTSNPKEVAASDTDLFVLGYDGIIKKKSADGSWADTGDTNILDMAVDREKGTVYTVGLNNIVKSGATVLPTPPGKVKSIEAGPGSDDPVIITDNGKAYILKDNTWGELPDSAGINVKTLAFDPSGKLHLVDTSGNLGNFTDDAIFDRCAKFTEKKDQVDCVISMAKYLVNRDTDQTFDSDLDNFYEQADLKVSLYTLYGLFLFINLGLTKNAEGKCLMVSWGLFVVTATSILSSELATVDYFKRESKKIVDDYNVSSSENKQLSGLTALRKQQELLYDTQIMKATFIAIVAGVNYAIASMAGYELLRPDHGICPIEFRGIVGPGKFFQFLSHPAGRMALGLTVGSIAWKIFDLLLQEAKNTKAQMDTVKSHEDKLKSVFVPSRKRELMSSLLNSFSFLPPVWAKNKAVQIDNGHVPLKFCVGHDGQPDPECHCRRAHTGKGSSKCLQIEKSSLLSLLNRNYTPSEGKDIVQILKVEQKLINGYVGLGDINQQEMVDLSKKIQDTNLKNLKKINQHLIKQKQTPVPLEEKYYDQLINQEIKILSKKPEILQEALSLPGRTLNPEVLFKKNFKNEQTIEQLSKIKNPLDNLHPTLVKIVNKQLQRLNVNFKKNPLAVIDNYQPKSSIFNRTGPLAGPSDQPLAENDTTLSLPKKVEVQQIYKIQSIETNSRRDLWEIISKRHLLLLQHERIGNGK